MRRFLSALVVLLVAATVLLIGAHPPDFISDVPVLVAAVLPASIVDEDLLGAFTVPEFSVRFKICKSLIYAEARAGRLRLSKIRSRTVITRGEAARYQRMLEDESAKAVIT